MKPAKQKRKCLKKPGQSMEIINCLFEFDISLIEIYITANYGPTYFYEDFLEVKSSRENFLNDLYDTLSDELCNNFNYEFTSVKIEIAK